MGREHARAGRGRRRRHPAQACPLPSKRPHSRCEGCADLLAVRAVLDLIVDDASCNGSFGWNGLVKCKYGGVIGRGFGDGWKCGGGNAAAIAIR